jgi:hypothetical protein
VEVWVLGIDPLQHIHIYQEIAPAKKIEASWLLFYQFNIVLGDSGFFVIF